MEPSLVLPVCLLLAVAALNVWAGDTKGHKDPNEIVTCIPCQDNGPYTLKCPPVNRRWCHSCKLTWCGCCKVCLVYLKEGDQCESFAPTNAQCGPGLECGSSLKCVRK